LFSKLLFDYSIPIVIKYILVFVSVVFTTIILAYLSYEYFEKYFLKVKMKFADVKSSGTKHLQIHDASPEKTSIDPLVSY
jgi:peptidoglycan/LPS O-acetylase OafA/YrhL